MKFQLYFAHEHYEEAYDLMVEFLNTRTCGEYTYEHTESEENRFNMSLELCDFTNFLAFLKALPTYVDWALDMNSWDQNF